MNLYVSDTIQCIAEIMVPGETYSSTMVELDWNTCAVVHSPLSFRILFSTY